MTVAQLIRHLEGQPPDATIVLKLSIPGHEEWQELSRPYRQSPGVVCIEAPDLNAMLEDLAEQLKKSQATNQQLVERLENALDRCKDLEIDLYLADKRHSITGA